MIADQKMSRYTIFLRIEALLMGLSVVAQQAITLLQLGTVTLLFRGYSFITKKSDVELAALHKTMIPFLCQGDTSFLQLENMILGHLCDKGIF